MSKERKLARIFSALSDETRIKILDFLILHGKLTVNQIRELIGTSLPAISYQLRILLSANLVKYEKKGKEKFFSITDENVRKILEDGVLYINTHEKIDAEPIKNIYQNIIQ